MTVQPGVSVETLLDAGVVSAADIERATATAAESQRSVVETLVEAGLVQRSELLRVAANSVGLEYVDLTDYVIDPMATTKLPPEFARRASVMPIGWDGGDLVIVAPLKAANDLQLKDDIARITKSSIRFAISARADIDYRIGQTYRAEGELSDLHSGLVDTSESDADLDALTEVHEDAPVVRFVDLLINQAIADRASDIHLEPTEHDLRVRYRVDGVLRDAHRAPRQIMNGVVSRFKIMGSMDIAEKRIPQDGRLTVNHNGRAMDLRVATLPTVWGEKIVCRVLDNSNTRLGLGDLGFSENNFSRFQESYVKPYGMILVTGPTGSGKSTTLYATLNILNQPLVNVITVEDPVEYRLPGINQVQTNPKAGLTFASALRSILRSDPDIVLIGEIRDQETAHIAVEAALTGHLVLSTLHTNDAPSAVTRLTEMGIEPFLVGSALDSVVAQRLCRALCEKCKEPYEPNPRELADMGFVLPADFGGQLYRPVGCRTCGESGYRGRMALHEVMTVTEELERLTVRRAATDEIGQLARQQGMTTLRDDGWLKTVRGRTSIEEVLRVVG